MARFNLRKESHAMAMEAWAESGFDEDDARDFLFQSCDGHELAIYYGKAIEFCATQDTSEGEQWLEDCGSLAKAGDTFGEIACRVAFATLLCACESALYDIISEHGESQI